MPPGPGSTKSHFGYKLTINVDIKYEIICKVETDTASTHDSLHFDNVFDTVSRSRDVHADIGYPSAEREAWLKARATAATQTTSFFGHLAV